MKPDYHSLLVFFAEAARDFDNAGTFPFIKPKSDEEMVFAFMIATFAELLNARRKFPDSICSHAALVEEVGEVSKALIDEPYESVVKECVQVAVMAMRVALEGDESFRYFRERKGLDFPDFSPLGSEFAD